MLVALTKMYFAYATLACSINLMFKSGYAISSGISTYYVLYAHIAYKLTLGSVDSFCVETAFGARGTLPHPLVVQTARNLVDDVAGKVVHLLAGDRRVSLVVKETPFHVQLLRRQRWNYFFLPL